MKSDVQVQVQEDEERLLGERSAKPSPKSNRRFTPCQWALIAAGVVLLFAAGNITGLFGLLRIPSIRNRLAPPPNIASNSTENLPELEDIGDVQLPSLFGTNESSTFINDGPPRGFSLTNPNVLGDESKNPTIPGVSDSQCSYSNRRQLGSSADKPAQADFIRVSKKIEIADVRQGGIGDCGFLASVISLIANGQQKELLDALELRDLGLLIARFLVPGTGQFVPNAPSTPTIRSVRVRIDDTLPQLSPSSPSDSCEEFIAARPGFADNRRNVFVPLLEKAFAKFVESGEGPESNFNGYAGLNGVAARNVLQALTGGVGRIYERFKPGYDLQMASFLVKCINLRRACVLGVPPGTDPRLGTPVGGKIDTQAGQITINPGSKSFTLRESGTNREIVIAGLHYYGIQATQFIDGQLITFENAEVDLHNPWGCNIDVPGAAAGNFFCGAGVPGSIRIKLSSLPVIATGVEWADPINLQ